MATIGILPTKNSIELREPDGDVGTIPAATARSAGCMTADHVQRLDEVWARATMSAMPMNLPVPSRNVDVSPAVSALKLQVETLMDQIGRQARDSLQSQGGGEMIDAQARDVCQVIITQMEAMDQRVRQLETVIERMSVMADMKAIEVQGQAA